MTETHLILLVERFAPHVGRSEATVSNQCVGHARLFLRLRNGCGMTTRTYHKAVLWFSENWPSDLEWPAGVERPKPIKTPQRKRA